MLKKVQNFLINEEGASAVEYGLIVGLIAIIIVVAVRAAGVSLSGLFDRISTALGAA